MNNEKTEALNYIPGRAPSEVVWARIENHLDKKTKRRLAIPEWGYALAIFSLITVIGIVTAAYFT